MEELKTRLVNDLADVKVIDEPYLGEIISVKKNLLVVIHDGSDWMGGVGKLLLANRAGRPSEKKSMIL